MAIVTLGIDLAKNVLALHGVDATGKAVLVRPNVPRSRLPELASHAGLLRRTTGRACSRLTATPCG